MTSATSAPAPSVADPTPDGARAAVVPDVQPQRFRLEAFPPRTDPAASVAGSSLEWRAIPGLHGYEVSADACVRRWITDGKWMRPLPEPKSVPVRMGHNGYLKFNHVRDGKRGTTDLHRAIGLAWLGPAPTPSHHVDHRDGNRGNCLLSNLRWASPSENEKAKRKGGSKTHLAANVRWARHIEGKSYGSISQEFGIDHRSARRYANAPA